jgi:hypothetical protein
VKQYYHVQTGGVILLIFTNFGLQSANVLIVIFSFFIRLIFKKFQQRFCSSSMVNSGIDLKVGIRPKDLFTPSLLIGGGGGVELSPLLLRPLLAHCMRRVEQPVE